MSYFAKKILKKTLRKSHLSVHVYNSVLTMPLGFWRHFNHVTEEGMSAKISLKTPHRPAPLSAPKKNVGTSQPCRSCILDSEISPQRLSVTKCFSDVNSTLRSNTTPRSHLFSPERDYSRSTKCLGALLGEAARTVATFYTMVEPKYIFGA